MFGNAKAKEENREQAVQEFIQKYHLEYLAESDPELLERLVLILGNSDGLNFVSALTGNQIDRTKISYLTALTEQNWIIINQLNRLNQNIEKLLDK